MAALTSTKQQLHALAGASDRPATPPTFLEIDTLTNMAGVLRPDFVADLQPADIDLTFDVKTKGGIHGDAIQT
jgi:NADP-dependent 3-hydroxy acid dehydrogenase YdfG